MKKSLSVLLIIMLLVMLVPSAFAYTGGPLDGNQGYTPGGQGQIIIDVTPEPGIGEYTSAAAFDITKDPGGETKKAGEQVVFTASATGADSVIWYVIDSSGKVYDCAEIGKAFNGVSATGTRSDRLVVSNITDKMNGCRFYAAYSADGMVLNTATATLKIEGSVVSPSPSLAPTPTVAPTPSPTPAYSTGVNGSSGGGTGVPSGTGGVSMMGTNTNNYSQDTPIGSSDTANEPTSGGAVNTAQIDNSRGSSHVGAYILAAIAGIVIIGSVLIMALYMRGKISLGKFEKFLGNIGGNDGDMFNDESGDYYNPDDFNKKS